MGSFSIWHWLVVLAVILVLFGGGNKISGLMGDFAKGIKSFKKNMAEEDDASMEEAGKPQSTIKGPENRAASTTSTREPTTTS
ncbi:twin-arginine translocase TatA/TatE family subunit [Rhodopila sp.]|jgi:sec-independent protein translocase protein TatA|uniref:twin-arginine translocase TatA/TatE family subunit n=1 Tax=Rhodopila sp. TaxID=2480087 RepID=UPI002BEF7F45|nr:twin-arginine translocase TatA/TatE family subunit [Rhodopila sp.]HVZ08784.1 twin-arginine translocase TatA/TatE family subunit [Rhodopila sp.]